MSNPDNGNRARAKGWHFAVIAVLLGLSLGIVLRGCASPDGVLAGSHADLQHSDAQTR
jgi:hypothetical protein